MARTQIVPFEHPVTDEPLMAVCEVTGRYSAATFNEPADYPEVDVFRIIDEHGANRPDVYAYVLEDDALRTSIEVAAVEQCMEDDDDAPDEDDDPPERDFYDDGDRY